MRIEHEKDSEPESMGRTRDDKKGMKRLVDTIGETE